MQPMVDRAQLWCDWETLEQERSKPSTLDLSAIGPSYQRSPFHRFMNKASVVKVARDQPWPRNDSSRQVAATILRDAVKSFHHDYALAKGME